ncbi:MAG: ATP-binding protein [Vicingaceae bacterium]
MKNLTPKQIAFRIAGSIALVVLLVTIVFLYFIQPIENALWLAITLFSASFILAYFLLIFAIEQFIYKKIKLIYKTIHNLKIKSDSPINLNKDVLSEVNQEVMEWDKSNKQEIERLKQLAKYRREYIGNIAHELKTPLFSIQGYILTLLEGGLNDPNINISYLEKAEKAVERMVSLIEDLDKISKLEAGTLKMEIKKINLFNLIEEVIKSLEDKAKKNNISLTFKNKNEKPMMAMADDAKISQVFVNLINNALKYTNKGGKIEVRCYDMDKNILIEIADNGIGIESKHLPRLFERFYRTDESRARDRGGSGLGLAIVKHIIEAHEQTINVRSEVGVGSTFSFTLKKA